MINTIIICNLRTCSAAPYHCFDLMDRIIKLFAAVIFSHHIKCSTEFIVRHQSAFSEYYIDKIDKEIYAGDSGQHQYNDVNYESDSNTHEPAGYDQRQLSKQPQVQIALYKLYC